MKLQIYFQKFSSSQQRQLGNPDEIMSDDGRTSSRFLWFSLASLERIASLQGNLQDEDLEKLDSASALHASKIVAQYQSKDFQRGDSGSSHSRYILKHSYY